MPVGAAIGGAAVVGGATTLAAGSKAAKAQRQGAETAANAELQGAQIAADAQRYMYDTTRADYAPGRIVGEQALYKLADMLGVARPTEATATRGGTSLPAVNFQQSPRMGVADMYGIRGFDDMPQNFDVASGYGATVGDGGPQPVSLTTGGGGFEASPGYRFRLDEGLKAIQRSASARGNLRSGATMKAIQRYGEGLAASEYDSYANRLASLAGVGQTATSGTAAAGQSAASGVAGAATAAGQGVAQGAVNSGNARASSYANTASGINSTINNLTSAYLYSKQPKYVLPGTGS